jgi:hypothetical protein
VSNGSSFGNYPSKEMKMADIIKLKNQSILAIFSSYPVVIVSIPMHPLPTSARKRL